MSVPQLFLNGRFLGLTFEEAERHLMKKTDLRDLRIRQKALAALIVELTKAREPTARINQAVWLKTVCRLRAGQLILAMPKAKGSRGQLAGKGSSGAPMIVAPENSDDTYATLGLSYDTAARLQRLARAEKEITLEKLRAYHLEAHFEVNSKRVDRYVEKCLQEDLKESLDSQRPTGCTILHCDFRDAPIDPDSVDVIITDPPYPTEEKEYLPLYKDLSKFAAKVLKPGGSLFCMAGQLWLFNVMRGLGHALQYHWVMAWLTNAAMESAHIESRHVNPFWKPILWYTKGPASYSHIETGAKKTQWVGDVIRAGTTYAGEEQANGDGVLPNKLHVWEQPLEGFEKLVKKVTTAKSIVCDPFSGSGTTGMACLKLRRKFIGCEADQDSYLVAKRRLADCTAEIRASYKAAD